MNMKGKVAIVSGGAQGIGEGICVKLAQLGASVAVLDLNLEGAEAAAERITAAGNKAISIGADITQKNAVDEAVATVVEKLGGVDIVVNNAGYTEVHKFIDEDEAYWDKLIAINMKGPFFLTQAALKHMIEKNNGGKIVNIASDSARLGNPGEAVYSATKGGLVSFTKSLAREVARYQITVNCVSPGPTNTPLMKAQPEKMIEGLKRLIPLRRIGEPEDIASMVAFLSSDEAAFVTGQIISVSGGLTMVG
jgi:2-hydroxycyclohexanecarboxyl-CoA dehydrogenase